MQDLLFNIPTDANSTLAAGMSTNTDIVPVTRARLDMGLLWPRTGTARVAVESVKSSGQLASKPLPSEIHLCRQRTTEQVFTLLI